MSRALPLDHGEDVLYETARFGRPRHLIPALVGLAWVLSPGGAGLPLWGNALLLGSGILLSAWAWGSYRAGLRIVLTSERVLFCGPGLDPPPGIALTHISRCQVERGSYGRVLDLGSLTIHGYSGQHIEISPVRRPLELLEQIDRATTLLHEKLEAWVTEMHLRSDP